MDVNVVLNRILNTIKRLKKFVSLSKYQTFNINKHFEFKIEIHNYFRTKKLSFIIFWNSFHFNTFIHRIFPYFAHNIRFKISFKKVQLFIHASLNINFVKWKWKFPLSEISLSRYNDRTCIITNEFREDTHRRATSGLSQ